jgi:hypothetical protein
MHVEIKEWKCWKEAVGQLQCYNVVDPKTRLILCCFGKYGENYKRECEKVANSLGIDVYEFLEDRSGTINLTGINGMVILTYNPEVSEPSDT